jgi:hypothetical protein
MKICINSCYGEFSLSVLGIKKYLERKRKECYFYSPSKYHFKEGIAEYAKIDIDPMKTVNLNSLIVLIKDLGDTISEINTKDYFHDWDIDRTDPDLIAVVEELGEKANGSYAKLKIIEIPDDTEFYIDEYDGMESVHEEHRSWY